MYNSKTAPLISVIIPVYNADEYLSECVDSVLKQTYKNLEIILVDDGSSDNSSAICDDYSLRDNRVKVIHKENGGVSSARNAGIEMASGKYIGFVDSDDYINNKMYEYLHKYIEKNDSQLAVCNFCYNELNCDVMYDGQGSIVYDSITAMSKMILGKPFAGHMCNKLLLTDLAKKVKLDKKIYMYEDLLYLWEYLKLCNKATYIPVSLYIYRQNNESVSYANYNYKHETAFKVLEKILTDTKICYTELYPYAVAANMQLYSDFAIIELRDRKSQEANKWLKEFRQRLKKVYSKNHLDYLGSNSTRNYVKSLQISIHLFKFTYRFYYFISKLSAVKKSVKSYVK